MIMTINYQGINLYYEKYGASKKRVVILPGWGETRTTFKEIINILKVDYTVYIMDYPGFLNTKFPNYDLTIYDYALLIKAFLEEEKIDNPYIIAHSFGGRIAIILASKYKVKIRKLVLIDSAGIKPKMTLKRWLRLKIYHSLQNFANFLPEKASNSFKSYLFKKFSSSDYLALDLKMQTTFKNIVNEDLTKYLSLIKIPTLLLWGANDIDTPLKDGKIMHKKITNSELVIFPNCTHYCYLENTYVIIRIILYFFDD